MSELTSATHLTTLRGSPREEVEAALVFDRSAARLLETAEAQLALARNELRACPDPGQAPEAWRTISRAIENAIRAQFFAMSFQARCRAAVTKALDGFGAADGSRLSDATTERTGEGAVLASA